MADRNAHTWVEVWFDGFGWLPFDPTPGRGQLGATYTSSSLSFDLDAVPRAGRRRASGRERPRARRDRRTRPPARRRPGRGHSRPPAVAAERRRRDRASSRSCCVVALAAALLLALAKVARRAAPVPDARSARRRRGLPARSGRLHRRPGRPGAGERDPDRARRDRRAPVRRRRAPRSSRRSTLARFGPPEVAGPAAGRARRELRRVRKALRARLSVPAPGARAAEPPLARPSERVDAIVMAAGEGRRLRPLTETLAEAAAADRRAAGARHAPARARRRRADPRDGRHRTPGRAGRGARRRRRRLRGRGALRPPAAGRRRRPSAVRVALARGRRAPAIVVVADTVYRPGDLGRFAARLRELRRRRSDRRSPRAAARSAGRAGRAGRGRAASPGCPTTIRPSPLASAALWGLGRARRAPSSTTCPGRRTSWPTAYQRAIDAGRRGRGRRDRPDPRFDASA